MEFIEFAKDLARESGEILRRGYYGDIDISGKTGRELVTNIDIEAETLIRKRINENYPDHRILAEEFGGEADYSGYLWVVDPLDGTNNFAHGFPFFSVSIALVYEREVLLGVVYEPLRDELFHSDGGVSFLNDKPIHVSGCSEVSNALFATGFPYDIAIDNENNIDNFTKFCVNGQGIRRGGSAALDLSYVAAGRLDGYWELKLKPWDIAAGFKILEGAGGIGTDYKGDRWQMKSDRIVAANPVLHQKMITIIDV